MKKTWKKLSEKVLFEHSRLKVYEDDVQIPSGETIQYIHFGKSHDAATVIAINDEGKILIQEEVSYPVNEWLLQFPGGGIEKGETPQQGAERELAEEAGQSGALTMIGEYYIDNRRRADTFYVFIATNLHAVPSHNELQEDFVTHWFSADEISEHIRSGKIKNHSLLAAWSLFIVSDYFPDNS